MFSCSRCRFKDFLSVRQVTMYDTFPVRYPSRKMKDRQDRARAGGGTCEPVLMPRPDGRVRVLRSSRSLLRTSNASSFSIPVRGSVGTYMYCCRQDSAGQTSDSCPISPLASSLLQGAELTVHITSQRESAISGCSRICSPHRC